MTRLIGIYGASGFGREVMPVVRDQHAHEDVRLVFIDDHVALPNRTINDQEVLRWQEFVEQAPENSAVAIAIADAAIREQLMDRCVGAGFQSVAVRARNVVTGDNIVVDEGAILQPFVTLTSDVRIGRGFHANIYSYVAHDCVIGDFVTFAPGVKCNGNVQIGDRAYIGTGAILRQGTPEKPLVIGAGATVGMGAVVTKDVPAGGTVVGNPARPLEKN